MIYLITGVPGSGKTLYMMSSLMKRADLQNRPLYLSGIQDVDEEKIPHKQIPEGHSVEDWYDWIEPNAILVVDECQRHFRKTSNAAGVPKHITELEVHRHYGIDIFLLTQHPRLLHINVKSFVENHIHISKTQLGTRRIWEWQGIGNPDNMTSRKDALVRPYILDKSAYGVYKSAEVHTKIKVKKSIWVYLFPIILISTIAVSTYAYFKVKDLLFTQNFEAAAKAASTDEQVKARDEREPTSAPIAHQSIASAPVDSNLITALDYRPELPGKPWTAPVYSKMNTKQNIQTMPFPVGCVKNGDKCTCYTEQATPIQNMDKNLCLDFVENGIYNEFKQSQQQPRQNPET